jgi:hypothetical protein
LNPSGDFSSQVCGLDYANNQHADPLFVSALTGNFHVRAGSPALGAGDPAYTPPFDFAGNPRLHADLGVYAG